MGRSKIKHMGGRDRREDFISKIIENLLLYSPIPVGGVYLVFFVLSLIVIVEIFIKKNKNNLDWYKNAFHVIVLIISIFVLLPLFPQIIKILENIILKFIKKEIPIGQSINTSTDSNKGYLNTQFLDILLDGVKDFIVDSLNAIVTLLLIVVYYEIVEQSNIFQFFKDIVFFIFFALLILYGISILFNVNGNIILSYVFLGIILYTFFRPLIFILSKIIQWAKKSEHFIIAFIILILFSYVAIWINLEKFKIRNDLFVINDDFNNLFYSLENISKSEVTEKIQSVIKFIVNLFKT